MSKKQQPHRDEKCQLKANNGFSMNDEDTLTPRVKLLLAQKTTLNTSTAKKLPLYTLAAELKVKTKQYIQRPKIPDLGKKMRLG